MRYFETWNMTRNLIRLVVGPAATFAVLLTIATGIWYWARSHYEAQIESYRVQVEVLELAFAEASSVFDKTLELANELREPQLWRVDTVYFNANGYGVEAANNPLRMYGGLVKFSFRFLHRSERLVEGTYGNEISGIPYKFIEPSPRTTIPLQDLHLMVGKGRFEFAVGEINYYLHLTAIDSAQTALAVHVYKLNPLYLPGE